MGETIRLDKFLVDMGKGSRSQVKEAGKKGRIQVNGQVEKTLKRKIDLDVDQVTLDGEKVQYRRWEYFLLNKPKGVVSATEDKRYKTVVDLLGEEGRRDLFPVGRLDLDTEGLLLLTNDGELAHRLLSPKKHVDKKYYARISGCLPKDAVLIMAQGMVLEDGTKVMPGRLELADQGENTENIGVFLTIQEGKFHQVKRMFQVLGCQVEYLKRVSFGTLALDEGLLPGQYRRLTEDEVTALREHSSSREEVKARQREQSSPEGEAETGQREQSSPEGEAKARQKEISP